MTNVSTTLSSTVSEQQMSLGGRSYRGAADEQPATKKMASSAHSALCACAGCFPDPIA